MCRAAARRARVTATTRSKLAIWHWAHARHGQAVTLYDEVVPGADVKAVAQKWWGKIRLYVAGMCVGLLVYAVYALKLTLDLVTGVALITLLFMMLQTEHERCDRVRSDWHEVRRAAFALASAVQWAQKDEAKYGDEARASLQEFYRTLLLYGKGSLRAKYQAALKQKQAEGANLAQIVKVFPELDLKAEQKFKSWTLVWL